MSEVHRYDVVVMLSEAGGRISYDPHGPEIVMAEHFDRVTAERDAALEDVEALKHWRDLALQFDNHRMQALGHLKTLVSDGAHYDAAAAFLAEPPVPASELQQRLTAADERAVVLEGLLREVQKSARKQDWASGYPTLFASVDAALKPAEGGGDA